MAELASFFMYIYFCVFRGVNAGACYHCVFFNSFPWNNNDLPSQHSHNWYAFVFYSNMVYGPVNVAIDVHKIPYPHYWVKIFNRFSRWFIVVFPRIFSVVASNLMHRGEWLGKYFYLLHTSRNQTLVAWLNMCVIKPYTKKKNILTLSSVYNRHN